MSRHSQDHDHRPDPLGGGPAEAIAAMRRAVAGRVEARPGQGIKNNSELGSIQGPNGQLADRGRLAEFTYTPELLQTGYLVPGGRPAVFFAGLKFRHFIKQKQTGWSAVTPVEAGFRINPIDGFSGKLLEPIKSVDGLPHNVVPAAEAL